MKKHILIVEDESEIASALAVRLNSEGFAVSVADNGIDGLDLALNEDYELAILDIMLPGLSGIEIAQKLREQKDTAILMLSARDDENDIVDGLNIGADDYVTKPFSAREVVARVNALIRRKDIEPSNSLRGVTQFGELTIDSLSHSISIGSKFVHTTPTEFKLLSVLCSKPGTVYAREDLVETLSFGAEGENSNELVSHTNLRTVDSHVRSLRKKIGSHFIRTVHAVGYSFEPNSEKTQVSA